MDFSAPHLPATEVNIDSPYPISLNASINKKEYKSTGCATKHVLKQLLYWGPGTFFSKLDWQVLKLNNVKLKYDKCVTRMRTNM